MEVDPIRMCELLVGLPDVNLLGVDDGDPGAPILVHVEARSTRPRCDRCGEAARVKERPVVELVDLPAFGRPARLVWRKHRWVCPAGSCPMRSWTGEEPRIGLGGWG